MKLFIFLLVVLTNIGKAQTGYDAKWIVGNNAMFADFSNKPSVPNKGVLWSNNVSQIIYFSEGTSNICDSATGELLIISNGAQAFNIKGQLIENGDHLVPNNIYNYIPSPDMLNAQGSLILPKGNNQYYLINNTITDSALTYYLSLGGKVPYNLLQYHVIDMHANNGDGKVIRKNVPLIQGIDLNKCLMQACRHANGVDWWLLKQGGYDTNIIYKFLVTADSIYGPFSQSFAAPKYPSFDLCGQMAFSQDGKKIACVQGTQIQQLFLADFDRCSGTISNPQVFTVPIDSQVRSNAVLDSPLTGVCFSPNSQFIYITRNWNIYQYEWQNTDSTSAWFRVQHGADTSKWQYHDDYQILYNGPDDRMYIGKFGKIQKQTSVINLPNNKGSACQFCQRCFRIDSALGLSGPPNMPNFRLGKDSSKACWPLDIPITTKPASTILVYPNPASTSITIHTNFNSPSAFILYDVLGKVVLQKKLPSGYQNLNVSVQHLPAGIYYYKWHANNQHPIVGQLTIIQ